MRTHMCDEKAHVWRSEDRLKEQAFPFNLVNSEKI